MELNPWGKIMCNAHFNGTCKEELEGKCEKISTLKPVRGVLLILGTCDLGSKRESVTSRLQLATKDAHQDKALNWGFWKPLILTSPQEGRGRLRNELLQWWGAVSGYSLPFPQTLGKTSEAMEQWITLSPLSWPNMGPKFSQVKSAIVIIFNITCNKCCSWLKSCWQCMPQACTQRCLRTRVRPLRSASTSTIRSGSKIPA